MKQDGLRPADVRNTLLRGELWEVFTDNPRGARFVFVGKSVEDRTMAVVCRSNAGRLRIVTVYSI